jgi:hypothetical protein
MIVSKIKPITRSIVYTLAALLAVVLLSITGSHKVGSAPSAQSTLDRLQSGN